MLILGMTRLTIDNKLTENGTTTFSGETGSSKTYVMFSIRSDELGHRTYDVTFRLYTNTPYISTEITTHIDANDLEIWAANLVTDHFTVEQIARKVLGLPLYKTEDITPALAPFPRPGGVASLQQLADEAVGGSKAQSLPLGVSSHPATEPARRPREGG
jgi:hypothetical protein